VFSRTGVVVMCKFCFEHGGGKKWYLNPDNFSDKMLDDEKRREVLADICGYGIDYYIGNPQLNMLRTPGLGAEAIQMVEDMLEQAHGGQVLPLEDALKLIDLAENFVLLRCMCRRVVGAKEEFTCLNFGPIKEYFELEKPSEPMKELTADEAKEFLRESDRKGLVHWVGWAKIPYPVAICNCDTTYCTSYKARMAFGVKNAMLKSHYIATVDWDKCDGCYDKGGVPMCISRCPYGALTWVRTDGRVTVDVTKCFGCGACRSACDTGAIKLVDREQNPIAKNLW